MVAKKIVPVRAKIIAPSGGGNYFSSPKSERKFIGTGSTMLDLALGGGWARGRVSNIVGDKCLSGDAIVSVKRGVRPKKMDIRTLFNRVNGKHPNRSDAETFVVADVGGYAGLIRLVDIRNTGVKVVYAVTNEHGDCIKVTRDHRFATPDGWKCLSEGLRIGSVVKRWRSKRSRVVKMKSPNEPKPIELSKITSIKKVGREETFDLETEAPHHNFIADGYVVHNSTGKTLLMIEACATFERDRDPDPKGKAKPRRIRYRESEAAFDLSYAKALGMPVEAIDFGEPLVTVEDLFEDLERILKGAKGPELVVVDSLDALSDRAEMERDFDQGSFGAAKAKKMSELFRRLVQTMEAKDVTLLIVSQVRDKIGAMFGRKVQRTGGRALDFYASQVIFLAHVGRLTQTVRGQKRVTGVKVKAQVDKNKVSNGFRDAEFRIRFGYGVNDAQSMVDFLKSVKAKGLGINEADAKEYLDVLLDGPVLKEVSELKRLREMCAREFYSIETELQPARSKYGV